MCFVELTNNPPDGILAGPVSDENFFEWEALITLVEEERIYLNILFCCVFRGPSGTPFEFGVFVTRLHFPSDYPLSPPKMKFISEIFIKEPGSISFCGKSRLQCFRWIYLNNHFF